MVAKRLEDRDMDCPKHEGLVIELTTLKTINEGVQKRMDEIGKKIDDLSDQIHKQSILITETFSAYIKLLDYKADKVETARLSDAVSVDIKDIRKEMSDSKTKMAITDTKIGAVGYFVSLVFSTISVLYIIVHLLSKIQIAK